MQYHVIFQHLHICLVLVRCVLVGRSVLVQRCSSLGGLGIRMGSLYPILNQTQDSGTSYGKDTVNSRFASPSMSRTLKHFIKLRDTSNTRPPKSHTNVSRQREPYSPTSLTREQGHEPLDKYPNSKSSRWKKRWQGWEIAIGISGSMFLYVTDKVNESGRQNVKMINY